MVNRAASTGLHSREDGGSDITKPARATLAPSSSRWRLVLALAFITLVAAAAVHQNPPETLDTATMYTAVYRPQALVLLSGQTYQATYPLWGYPLLIAGARSIAPTHTELSLELLQVVLACLLVVKFSWRWLGRWPLWTSAIWAVLLLPVFVFACYLVADAVVMLCIMAAALGLRNWLDGGHRVWLALIPVAAAIGVTMRSEVLLFAVAAAIVGVAAYFARRTQYSTLSAIVLLAFVSGALLGTLPWTLHTARVNSAGLLTATNGPGVMWLGLGQLPHNPWGHGWEDRYAGNYAQTRGVADPFQLEGSRLMRSAFVAEVKEHPGAFARKMAHTIGLALAGGVTGGRTKPVFRLVFVATSLLSVAAFIASLRGSDATPATRVLLLLMVLYTASTLASIALGLYWQRLVIPLYALQVLALAQFATDRRARRRIASAFDRRRGT